MKKLPALLAALVFFAACTDKHAARKEHKASFFTTDPIKKRDSVQDAFYKNKYYLPKVIRLDAADKEAFISIDSPFFHMTRLDNNNREAYYKKVVQLLPKEDIEAYRTVWKVP